jgi:MYXO-CTERM domain-containing protein
MRVVWGVVGALLLCSTASAYESLPQPVTYAGDQNLFDDFGFDTGWVPAGSPIQVHFALSTGSGWSATLSGHGHLGWPEPVGLQMLGDPGGGLFHMNVGVQLVARLRVHLELPTGGSIDWEGDVPYVPNFDFRFAADATFTPFLLPGGNPTVVTLTDTIDPVTLFQVDLTNLIGVSIPGVSGGFELQAGGTLTASLRGERFDVEDAAGAVLGAIDQYGATALLAPPQETHLTAWPRYRATLHPTGTLNLVPAVYVSFASWTWDLPLFTIPINVVDTDMAWDFGTQETTFPLPDIRVPVTALGFGTIAPGETATRELRVENHGEMDLEVEATPDGSIFSVTPGTLTVAPGSYEVLQVQASSPAGETQGTLTLASNDPDEPIVTVTLSASGRNDVEQTPGDGGVAPPPPTHDVGAVSGCGCRTAPVAPGPVALLLALALLVRGRGRRRG